MLVRTTSFVQFERAATELRRQQLQSLKYQSALTSGTRIDRPSDDPTVLPPFLGAHRDIKRIEGVLSTLNQVKQQVSVAHDSVRQAQSILVDAKVLASEVRQVTEPVERQAIAQQIDNLLKRMVSIANEQGEYGYLFSGGSPETRPFVESADGSIQYQGASDASQVNIDGRSPIDRLLAGSVVFEYTDRQNTLFFGSTGAKPGVGTDSGEGRATLTVSHTATSFAPGSGVTAGTSSAGGDTILGPLGANVIHIDDTSGTGASGTVSLNGGAPVAFTSADTNLEVTGPNGEVIYLDTTAITAGFVGDVDVQSDGTLSADGGLTQTAIDFTSGQAVVDSRNNAVTFVDSTDIRDTGTEAIEYPGTANVFEALTALRDQILNAENLSPTEWQDAITRRMEDVDRLSDHLLQIIGSTGVDLQYIEETQAEFDALKLAAEKTETDLGGTDYADAILRLQQHQFQYQVVLAATTRLFDVSILDFLG